ncbi:neuromusculin isoform X5 [Cotesia typhae]|uniref:neuromusculin isoform X5 n=1 Tax=Cotesia typhae TaxID=2053667 RepID=UPI003D68BE40
MTPLGTYTIVFMVNIFFQTIVEGMEPWKKSEKNGEQGSEIQLPCILKSPKCGGLHSIKWYRGSQRILIFSESAGITRGNNDIAARSTMNYNQNATKTYLKISDLKLEDEGLYKCEATYLAVNRECNNVQHITLNTTVRPKFLRITEEDDNTNLTSGTILGPINEGTLMTLNCESDQGKPVPTVEWYKGDKRLKAIGSTKVRENGVGIGSSVLQLQVGRSELGATFTCKISSLALAEPLTVDIKLDVHVRPLKMDVKGVVGHVVSGTKILLECKVSAARPPANVTWYNGTDFLTNDNDRFEMFETKIDDNSDGTSETSSYLAFTASEYDNGQTFSCFAENSVTRIEGIKPMKEATTIEVLYAPIITMRPANITVNETEDFVIICNYEANPAGLTSVKWLQNDQELELNEDHYEGGVTEQTSLTVKNASASDMGTYKCVLSNSVGESTPENTVDVSVLYKPIVKVIVEPEVPINEADRLNVSLTCYVINGNPINLNAVRWYLDGDLLKELPDCNIKNNSTITLNMDDTLTFCDIDPSKLLLEAVGRSFHGNYSCEGRNDAGWGLISPSTPVIVYYKPGPAMISYKPKRVIKGSSLNITCTVTDPGRPAVTGYKWIRGMHRLADQEKSILTIDSVNLRTKANFTCIAYNQAGDGDSATTFIDVAAPPAFINPLAPYHGYVYNAVNVSIGCRVECSPICNVSWIKNNEPINFTVTDRYYVTNVYHPADQSTSDFESIQSNLTWNLDKWPNKQLDRFQDNDNYTCISSDNDVGQGVHSTTHFQVEFPPENMTISKKIIEVIVDFIPDSVKCGAVAHPEPTFRWYRQGSTETISQSSVLIFETKVPKRSNGTYFCEATNRHGTLNISTYLNVLYKPECQINKERINGEDYLVCTAVGNPKESNFSWSLKSDNDSLGQLAEIRHGQSYLLLDTAVTNFRTYICIANNSIGSSLPCERGVPGNLPWWIQLEGDLLIIVIIIIITVVIAIVVCCVIVYLICRRKQMHAKYPGHQGNKNSHIDSVSEALQPESDAKTFYENLPFHGIQTPPNKQQMNKYDYRDHYQKYQQQKQQEMQQYKYNQSSSSCSNSSYNNNNHQLKLPLTRSLYNSSAVNPLLASLIQTNLTNNLNSSNIITKKTSSALGLSSSGLTVSAGIKPKPLGQENNKKNNYGNRYKNNDNNSISENDYININSNSNSYSYSNSNTISDNNLSLSLSLFHDKKIDFDNCDGNFDNYQIQNQRQSSIGQRRSDRKKHRKYERGNDRRIKHRCSSNGRNNLSNRSSTNDITLSSLSASCETSFARIQELGIPENFKISYLNSFQGDNNTHDIDLQQNKNKKFKQNSSNYYSDQIIKDNNKSINFESSKEQINISTTIANTMTTTTTTTTTMTTTMTMTMTTTTTTKTPTKTPTITTTAATSTSTTTTTTLLDSEAVNSTITVNQHTQFVNNFRDIGQEIDV